MGANLFQTLECLSVNRRAPISKRNIHHNFIRTSVFTEHNRIAVKTEMASVTQSVVDCRNPHHDGTICLVLRAIWAENGVPFEKGG